MAKFFSEKYGYETPSSVLIRERLTDDITNSICTGYDRLMQQMGRSHWSTNGYSELEEHLWCIFLNKRLNDFYTDRGHYLVATTYIEDKNNPWYKKLEVIERTLLFLKDHVDQNYGEYREFYQNFLNHINEEFQRLHFAYRIIDNQIVEITSEEEIAAIEVALQNPLTGVREHLHTALKHLSNRPNGDYRNSIKESISAVEVVVREITGAKTLKIAELEGAGLVLPSVLKQSFEKLYGYTNDATTGIRHALMDDANAPGADEAIFMLISCSAFINYLQKKKV